MISWRYKAAEAMISYQVVILMITTMADGDQQTEYWERDPGNLVFVVRGHNNVIKINEYEKEKKETGCLRYIYLWFTYG